MKSTKKRNFEQLNKIKRAQIELGLKTMKSMQEIANSIELPRETVYREVIRNSTPVLKDKVGIRFSCIHYLECKKKNKSYRLDCPPKCINYQPGRQTCLKKFPFVCNYCKKKNLCSYMQFYYDSENASIMYHKRISDDKKIPKTNLNEIHKVNKTISPLIKNGQSVEAALMNHPEIKYSPLTIRNWIKARLLDCKFSELRMTGRRIPSRQYDYSKKKEYSRLFLKKLGHRYNDYLVYIKRHPNSLIVQLDTVIGCFDGKYSILTIHIVQHKFQFGYILHEHTKEAVYDKVNSLLDKLKEYEDGSGIAIYTSFSEILLTDNGFEFDSLVDLCDKDSNIHVFYCHPLSSHEKGSCERNHVLLRYIHYKGWSFDGLEQEDIDLLFSHINSYPRKSLQKKTPYQSVLNDPRLGKEFLDIIHISKINGDELNLTPSLLKRIKK